MFLDLTTDSNSVHCFSVSYSDIIIGRSGGTELYIGDMGGVRGGDGKGHEAAFGCQVYDHLF